MNRKENGFWWVNQREKICISVLYMFACTSTGGETIQLSDARRASKAGENISASSSSS